jgi:outer membrane receptor protein involved in Fe transport
MLQPLTPPKTVARTACVAFVLTLAPVLLSAAAQTNRHLTGQVRDSAGHTVPGVRVSATIGSNVVTTPADASGNFVLNLSPGKNTVTLRALAPGLQSDSVTVTSATSPAEIKLVLHPAALTENVTVTATRSSISQNETANTIYELDQKALTNYPATALDDKLRQQAGFELFRRASSHIQNPTSQGISLRGLGSTAVSRSLVLEDGVPLNDAFGGWIHWDELPQFVLDSVNIATGGGSDLYGSSALGGVIDVITQRPTTGRFDVSGFGGGQDTSLGSARADIGSQHLRQLLAADLFRTAGYITTAPSVAGPVDKPSNVHYQSGLAETDYLYGTANRAFITGDVLNEARNNGTRLQTNGTRLWRYIGGDDWNAGAHASGRTRLFGSDQAYRQTFSSILSTNGPRTVENLTRVQRVHTQELGASADASFALSPIAIVTGADLRDIRGTDDETPISAGKPNGVVNTSARQRFVGGFGEILGSHGPWSAALSLRLDRDWNLDTRSIALPNSVPQPTTTPNRSELIASPRLGIIRELGKGSTSLHASVFRAFRTPSMNELYRTGQVGQETTQANAQLQSERATGWEVGAHFAPPAAPLTLTANYFGTLINRPVSAVLVSSTATTITNKRQNLGRIVSQGFELHSEIRPGRAISGTLGYQYAHAVVTQFSAQPNLIGKWIPQVPRQSFTAQLRAFLPAVADFTLAARASGHAFDDSSNNYVLNHYFQLDLYVRRSFRTHWAASVSLQNLTNQRPDVARTPTPTLGSPFLAQGGIEYHWSRSPLN